MIETLELNTLVYDESTSENPVADDDDDDPTACGIQDALKIENQRLRDVVNESNESMKWVCDKLAEQQGSWRHEKEEFLEKFDQARSIITNLKLKLKEKDNLVSVLQEKNVVGCSKDEAELQTHLNRLTIEIESCRNLLSLVENEKQALLQKCSQLESQNLIQKQIETTDKEQIASLKRTISDFEQKISNQTIENQILNKSLVTFRKRFDELLEHCQYLSSTQSEDRVKDLEGKLDSMTAQLVTAEGTLESKDNHIAELQKLNAKLQQDKEMLLAQSEVYKADFEAERHERETLNDQKNLLQSKIEKLEMMLMTQAGQRSQRTVDPRIPFSAAKPIVPLVCPKCGSTAPDIDTLQRHCNGCIV